VTAVLDGTPDALAAHRAAGSVRPTLVERYPARPAAASWAATRQGREQVMDLAGAASSDLPESRVQNSRRRGLPLLLDWLEEQPGQTWQDRWLASGADDARGQWGDLPAGWLRERGLLSKSRLELMTSSLLVLVGAGIIRPSLGWLLTGGRKRKLARNMIRARDPEGFARLSRACDDDPGITPHAQKHVLFRVSVIIAAKGGAVAGITIGDVLEILSAEDELRGKEPSGPATFRVLREAGIFGDGIPTLREIRDAGQRTVGELVDRYPLACRPVRDLIVDYLRERQPSIDYVTLKNRAYELARCFWADLEQHHPGIDSLRLTPEMAAAWKQRLRARVKTVTSGGKKIVVEVERLSCLDVMSSVRCFYLDLSEWALQDPARWGPWVAPSPVGSDDLDRRKAVRRRKARMDARTRDRLPVLPVLVSAAARWRKDVLALLEAGRQARPGEEFTAAGQTLIRSARPHASPGNVWAHDPAGGPHRLLNREEEHAFWAWAAIEVLRMTGCRVEELTELSHHSLVQYRLPDTGEIVPLLQIAPSKTDMERLILVSPELADVLSAVICRIRGCNGAVPLVRARDQYELIWLQQSPPLFQRRVRTEHHAFTGSMVNALLDEALGRTGLTDPSDGGSLRYTAHDFRRIFITDAVLNGLPPHIAQVIAGHQDITVTMGYKAVYPQEAIEAHRAFIARRRAIRPGEEYRTPSEEEWDAFLAHFEKRKVSVGTCARAFGTPCIHEHACVRCSLLRPSPGQRDRLEEIRANLHDRIAEAEREGWLGEVEGLKVSLAGAEDKLAQITASLQRKADAVQLGTPAFPDIAGRSPSARPAAEGTP
jgi:hypothetical protein